MVLFMFFQVTWLNGAIAQNVVAVNRLCGKHCALIPLKALCNIDTGETTPEAMSALSDH